MEKRILEYARKVAFWAKDFVQGSPIKKQLDDIRFIQAHPHLLETQIRREKHLRGLLEHAAATVPYYKARLRDQALEIDNFPVINKALIIGHYDQFRSNTYVNRKNHAVSTSGSTGNPFKLFHDKGKRHRSIADTMYFSKITGFDLGTRLYYLRLWDKQYKKAAWLSWAQNIDMQSVDELGEGDIEKWLARYETDSSNKSILAYTSALRSICQYLDKIGAAPLATKTHSVIAMAESLDDYVKEGIKKYFKVIPISRYSNSENGILAQQSLDPSCFKINRASYHIEILDLNKDIPVKLGESGRIVITDFFNYCMPMIRYDTGDVGRMGRDANNTLVFTDIEGRKMDMFTDTQGKYVSSHIVHHILQFEGVDQFQFIQEKHDQYHIKLKVNNRYDYGQEPKLIDLYRGYFGADADIRVDYVADIPLLQSGKRKLVTNNVVRKNYYAFKVPDSKLNKEQKNANNINTKNFRAPDYREDAYKGS